MQVTTIGLDLAKNVFQVHGINENGEVAFNRALRRGQVLAFFERLEPSLIGMEMLTWPENLTVLADLPGRWIDAIHDRRPPKSITLDMDSSESPVHGDQEG